VTAKTIAAACLLLLCACSADRANAPEDDRRALSVGQRYMTDVIAIMQANSINRLTIDWSDFRTRVLAAAAGTTSDTATRDAMQLAIQLLGDGHSFFRDLDGRFVSAPLRTCNAPAVLTPVLPDDLGYVRIFAFTGSFAEGNAIATAFHLQLQRSDSTPKAGWIVDLRGNTGGNLWPMLASVGPILGEGVACGVSTANVGFQLGTGSLGLTVSTMADRTKARFGARIWPDEELTDGATAARAIAWLRTGQ